MVDERTDEMLMTAVRRGRRAELSPLFERHSRRLFGFLRGLVGSPSVAEDLVQETFLRILRHRRSYRPGRPFLPWMLGIARNVAWSHLGKASRLPPGDLPERAGAAPQEERQLRRERTVQLGRALRQLSTEDREVLLLSYFDGLKHREIAELVGKTPGAVKVRVHRARQALREKLAPREETR